MNLDAISLSLAVLSLAALCSCLPRVVDLSHPFNAETHKWPTNPPFELRLLFREQGLTANNESYYMSGNIMTLSEHTGTHLDAPRHFSEKPGTWAASEIPVNRLVAPVAHLNLRAQAASDRDYLVSAEDIMNHETKYGQIEAGSVVLLDFGWAKYWSNYTAYFGTATNDTTQLHFPGLGLKAAKRLADRGVYGVGLDTPSMDRGMDLAFETHAFLLAKNIYFLENVADMSELPYGNLGVTLISGVMKIDNGTGGPVRLIALVNDDNTPLASQKAGMVALDNIIAVILSSMVGHLIR